MEEVIQAIKLITPDKILRAMNKIAKGLTKSKLSDITVVAYIQSSVNTGTLFLRAVTK
jgi:hypothetical protein